MKSQRYMKVLCVASVASIFALGVLTIAQDEERANTASPVPTPNMTVGRTTTEETATEVSVPPSVEVTNSAQPTLKAPRPKGF